MRQNLKQFMFVWSMRAIINILPTDLSSHPCCDYSLPVASDSSR